MAGNKADLMELHTMNIVWEWNALYILIYEKLHKDQDKRGQKQTWKLLKRRKKQH